MTTTVGGLEDTMTDKVINIFNKQPVETEADTTGVNETIDNLIELRESLADLLIIGVTKEDQIIVSSSKMSAETAYYLLGVAQFNALTQG
jgi:hypothetical protein